MKELFITTLNNINDDYLLEADTYFVSKNKFWVKWVAVAAGICLFLTAAIGSFIVFGPDTATFGGLESVQDPKYDVVEYSVPDTYDIKNLFVATTAELTEYDEFISDLLGINFMGKGIRVFEFVEGNHKAGDSVIYLETESSRIKKLHFVTRVNGEFLLTDSSGNFVRAIEALSNETDEFAPMYFVRDNEMLFAVVGSKAYYLPDFTDLKPRVAAMPEINIKGVVTTNVVVLEAEDEDENGSILPQPDQGNSGSKEPISASPSPNTKPEVTHKNLLPDLNYSVEDKNFYYNGIGELSNGDFVGIGYYSGVSNGCVIRHFDPDTSLLKEYSVKEFISFNAVQPCSDGGFFVMGGGQYDFAKFNDNFEIVWGKKYDEGNKNVSVNSITELSSNRFILSAFITVSNTGERYSDRFYIDGNGEQITDKNFIFDHTYSLGQMLPDGKGGFYSCTTISENNIGLYPILNGKYDPAKGTEVGVLHYNENFVIISGIVFGGTGNDKPEEFFIDSDGNYYVGVYTDWKGLDEFWQQGKGLAYNNRRMLVKLDVSGNILAKTHLVYSGMAIDQIFGIFEKKEKIYTFAKTSDKGYVICSDKATGEEIYRNQFYYCPSDEVRGAVFSKGGMLVIAGQVEANAPDYNLDFPEGIYRTAALLVYTYLE